MSFKLIKQIKNEVPSTNRNRILSEGSVAERIMIFEKCPEVKVSTKPIKRRIEKPMLKGKIHSEPHVILVAASKNETNYNIHGKYIPRMTVYCHDNASKFIHIMSRGQRSRPYIIPNDLEPLVQDVVDTHPGLAFLRQATEFHSKYVQTVIARIFYAVNRSWSGKITALELRNSDFLETIRSLEIEDDINQIMAFFSYEHFYVIYCKFWELDSDHDFHLSKRDLGRYSDHALSSRIIDRIFSECIAHCTHSVKYAMRNKMTYMDFVWFLLSEEDKRTPTAIEYWFRCMDVDGDGLLSLYELEYFYEEQQQRMDLIGIEILPFVDCICQMLDMIKPKHPEFISLSDLKKCKLTNVFFDTFFNLEKFLQHEQRDPLSADRDDYVSDWERYAAEEYEILISEDVRAE